MKTNEFAVAFHSPLPPARTGVADYSAALLRALRRFGSVEGDARQADVHLYHLGNNQLHRGIYQRALAQPGVVVLHDAVLQHFFLGSLDESQYIDEFTYNYGNWHRDTARDLYRRRAASAADARYFAFPMLQRIAETSRAVIVHNGGAARMVRDHAPHARVIEIPHLFDPPPLPTAGEALRFRQRLGIPACAFLLGVFGYLRESKRLLRILRAFASAHRECPNIYLLLAGDFVSSDLARAAEPLLDHAGIRRLPYVPERDFWLAAASVDACINLRYPAAGETSGVAIRLMGMAKPVLVTAGLEVSAFPETACLRIDPGIAETAALRDHIIFLASFPQVAGEIGRRGAGHIASQHSVGRVAELYWKVLCEHGRS
jgi:glycosyltransferase involved in cell wall biosynthesis